MGSRRVTGPRRWIPAILAVAGAAVFLTAQLSRAARNVEEDGVGAFSAVFIPLLVAVGLVAVIMAWFMLQSRERRHKIADDHPGVRQVQFVPTSELAVAAKSFMARIPTISYGTMIVSDGRLKLFVGGGEAPRLDLPVMEIIEVSVGESLAGRRWMLSIDLMVTSPNGPVRLPIVPMRDGGNIFRMLTETEVETMAQQLRQEVGAPV
jgi:hypothetical protein